MSIKTKKFNATLKTGDVYKTTVKDTNKKTSSLTKDHNAQAQVMGIPGEKGDKGDVGDTGSQGIPGPIGPVGLIWLGDYNPSATYQQRNGVHYAGTSYIYINALTSTGIAPPDPLYWDVLATGGSGGDKTHIHVQNAASTEWLIIHNLAKFPSVTVVDSGNTEVEGCVEFVDPNTIKIIFSAAFGGRAYLN